MSILEVVEGERPNLTDEHHEKRSNAIKTINSSIAKSTLNVREVAVLTEFYRERLKDVWQTHGSVMTGMLHLVKQPKYPGSALSRLMPLLNQELHVQSLDAPSREVCAKFFIEVIKRHAAWIEQFNQQFCQLVITSFDGETDPRVLLHHFKLVQIIHEKKMPGESKHMWDEILDICACYFPVEFEPDEKDNITRDDLTRGLMSALTSGLNCGSKMAKKTHSITLIEMIIDKLHSESDQAIDDSLVLLDVVLDKMDMTAFDEADAFNELLQCLIIKVGKRQNDEKAQETVIESIEQLARTVHSTKYAAKGLEHIFALTEDFITPPFKPALWPAIKVYAAWSRSGCDSLGKCLPTLLPALSHPASAGEALDAIVSLANKSSSGANKNDTLQACLLDSVKNQNVPLQTKMVSISAVAACAKADLVTEAFLREVGLEVFNLSINAESEELSREAAHCLTFIGQKIPAFIQDDILPNFPENALVKEKYVLLLAQFIIMEGFIGYEICQKLVYMIRDHQLERSWDNSILAALDGMAAVAKDIPDGEVKTAIAELIIKELLNALITGVLNCGQDKNRITPLIQDQGMKYICTIVRGMAGSLTADDAIDIRSDMWKRFTCGSFSKGQGATKIYFKPFDASYSYFKNQEKILPFLTTFIMVQTPTTEPSNWNEYTEFLCRVLDKRDSTIVMRKAASKMLAAIINKNDNLDPKIFETIEKQSKEQDEKSLTLAVWVTKAMLLKGAKALDEWIDRLLTMASGPQQFGRTAADSWWILLGETEDLSVATGATIKMLYPQRLFNLALPRIKKVVDGGDDRKGTKKAREAVVKENMLIILGHLLSMVPSEVQSRELPPLLPLLFEALETANDGLVSSSLQTLMQLNSSKSETVRAALVDHVETLVDCFVKIIYEKLSLRVRVKAFEALRTITYVEGVDHIFVRIQSRILAKLRSSLDDPKRVIRREAALCNNVWSMIGQPS